jgi:hypothetical protein
LGPIDLSQPRPSAHWRGAIRVGNQAVKIGAKIGNDTLHRSGYRTGGYPSGGGWELILQSADFRKVGFGSGTAVPATSGDSPLLLP